MLKIYALLSLAVLLLLTLANPSVGDQEEEAPAEIALGERLFKDPRFSHLFFELSDGDPNKKLSTGDPVLDWIEHFDGDSYSSPFSGQTMSCASCHMVDQALEADAQLGMRVYTDFSIFSPIPGRDDGATHTLRNSQAVVMPYNPKGPTFFHWDGEFNTLEDLVYAGLGGRNMGWKPNEKRTAHHHLFHVLVGDDGSGDLAQEFGGLSYSEVFLSEDPLMPEELRLPEHLRLDLSQANPHITMQRVAFLISEYIRDSQLQKDDEDNYNGSPYDLFLRKNELPTQPRDNETDMEYSQRLLRQINSLDLVQFVSRIDNNFTTHNQEFSFGPRELEGLKLFLTTETDPSKNMRAGACVRCHTPPHFTDFGFHNIGIGQLQYERTHGFLTYKELEVPNVQERNENLELYGTANYQNPDRLRILGSKPNKGDQRAADLGVWNVYLNPDYPHLQSDLELALRASLPDVDWDRLSEDQRLKLTAGMSKTPTLRDLGHSAPYFRDGHARTIHQVVSFYIATAQGARIGTIENADPQLSKVNLLMADRIRLVRFLESLNEDYE